MRPEKIGGNERGAVDILGSKAVQEKISSGMTSKDFVKKLEVLQTVVRSVHSIKNQLGSFLPIHFYAPINEEFPEEEIFYDYKTMPSDYELISRGEDQQFLLKQCLKFGDYI